jgi:superfamily I DNA/RNA helicase
MFTPNEYQSKIFDWVSTGDGHGVVGAVAGSGKTTTLIEASKRIASSQVAYLAFNRAIIKELGERLPKGITAKTMNSLGLSLLYPKLGKTKLDKRKYNKIAKDLVGRALRHQVPWNDRYEHQVCLANLARLARLTLTDIDDEEAIQAMALKYDIEVPLKKHFSLVREVVREGEDAARYGKIIDFADQLYLPIRWNLEPHRGYEWVFSDEF